MREINFSTANAGYTGVMIIPDSAVFLRDANYLSIVFSTTTSDPINKLQLSLQVSVAHGADVDTKHYNITTNNTQYSINLATAFERFFDFTNEREDVIITIIFSGAIYTLSGVEISVPQVYYDPLFAVFDGFSLPNREHGTDTTAYAPQHLADTISMYINNPATIEGNIYSGGDIYELEGSKDECIKETNVFSLEEGGGWTRSYVDWAYGVKSIIVDRCSFWEKSLLVDEMVAYNFDMTDGNYTPISMRLIPRAERGYYTCEFFGLDLDGNFTALQTYEGRLLIAKEAPFLPLFGVNWSYRQNADDYYWVEVGYYGENGEFVFMEDVKMIVEYDDAKQGSTFSGRPMTAIMFKYWDLDIWEGDMSDYIMSFQTDIDEKDVVVRGALCMFGNHKRPYDAGAYAYNQIAELAMRSNCVPEWGDGFIGYWYDNGNYGTATTFLEKTTDLGNILTNDNQTFFYAYYNAAINNFHNLSLVQYMEWHEVQAFPVPTSYHMRYSQLNDTYNVMHPMTYGIGYRRCENVTIQFRLNNNTIKTARNRTLQLIPTNMSDDRVTYVSQPITILDNTNGETYYDYNGFPAVGERRYFVTITMEFPINDFILPNNNLFFERYTSNMYWSVNEGVTLGDVWNRCGIESIEFPSLSGFQATYERDYYLPFTCGVPYCVKNSGINEYERQSIFMFRLLTIGGWQNEGHFWQQAYRVGEGYFTYQNLGRTEVIGATTYNFAPNYHNSMTRMVNYSPLADNTQYLVVYDTLSGYDNINNARTLRLSYNNVGFNEVGDPSYTIENGCTAKRGHESLTEVTGEYTLYAFSMCDDLSRPTVWLKYKNMDGLWRYLPIEMIESTLKNSTQNLQFIKPKIRPINNYPYYNPYALEEKITCGLYNIPPDMHIEDMLYSRTLELLAFDGSYSVSVALEEDSITRRYGETEDFILHFIKKQ